MTVKRVEHAKLPELTPGVGVSVGWFASAKYPDGTPVAGVAVVQEFGTSDGRIPPRPFARPTIAANGKPGGRWSQAVAQSMRKSKSIEQTAHTLGNFVRGDMQEAIARVTTPELAEATKEARRSRGNSSTKPLVDTRVMMPTLNYEVDK